MAPGPGARAGWSRRAQYGLFFSFLAAIAGLLIGLGLLALSLVAPNAYAGVRGAALASVGSSLTAAALLVVYARWKERQREVFVRFWRPDWQALSRVCRLGLPIGLTSLAEVGLFSFASVLMGWRWR